MGQEYRKNVMAELVRATASKRSFVFFVISPVVVDYNKYLRTHICLKTSEFCLRILPSQRAFS